MSMIEDTQYEKGNRIDVWKKILLFARPYTVRMVFLGLLMIFVAILDGVFPYLSKVAIDNFAIPLSVDGLIEFGLLYILLALVQGLNVWGLITLAGRLEVDLCRDLRKAGFEQLQKVSLHYYDKTPAGWLLSRLTSDTMKLGETISWGIVDFVWGSAMMAAILVFMIFMHPLLTLVTLAVIPFLLLISRYFQSRILSAHRDARRINSQLSAAYNEGITGARTSKTLVREDANGQEFGIITDRLRRAAVRGSLLSVLYLPVVLLLSTIGSSLALGYGGRLVLSHGLTIGTLVAFLGYTLQFFEPVREIARVLSEFQAAQASAERLTDLIYTEPDITDTPEAAALYGTHSNPVWQARPAMQGEISLRNVCFTYASGETVLHNFNLHIPAGQTVALVGETGSGKSTLVNLVCRFYEPDSGEIYIDNMEYRTLTQHWLHSQLGYVLQTPQLFTGSIADNIRYGKLEASDKEVEQAAELVRASDFIARLPLGMNTQTGDAQLSTGQKQLISFARAVIADPALLILDEATSSIDTETEVRMQQAINTVLAGRTSIVIAHRLSTIRNVDRILVLDRGVIIQDGNHDALMQEKGTYRSLYTRQFLEKPVA